MTRLAFSKGYEIVVWDISRGLVNPMRPTDAVDPKTRSPLSPFSAFSKVQSEVPRVVLLWNYHLFIKEREVLQAFYNAVLDGQKDLIYYFVLSCTGEMPKEVEKMIVLHQHKLPSDVEIADIANDLLEKPDKTPVSKSVIYAARGLTRREVEGAFSISITTEGDINPSVVTNYKKESVSKSGFLTYYEGNTNFKNICGLEHLKSYCKKILKDGAEIQPHGVLLLGPPGTGKSQFAKALGSEINRPVLMCDIGKIYAKHVGETEANLRELIDIAESVAPCILFIDELEKALGGSKSGNDSGVSLRVFGRLLTWLSDKTSDVFVIGTCNDVSSLDAAFAREGRFDSLFFVDLPSKVEREKLWAFYLDKYSVKKDIEVHDEGWTGAEIEGCVKKSKQLDISLANAAKYIIPVSLSRKDEIEKLRDWSKLMCLSSDYEGKYIGAASEKQTTLKAISPRRTLIGEV